MNEKIFYCAGCGQPIEKENRNPPVVLLDGSTWHFQCCKKHLGIKTKKKINN